MLTSIEKKLLYDFLEQLSNKMGSAVCNDFDLPNTPENLEFAKAFEQTIRRIDHAPEYTVDVRGTKILFYDFMLVGYLKYRLKEEFGDVNG